MRSVGFFLFLSVLLISCSPKFACKDVINIEGEKCETLTSVHEKYIEKGKGTKPSEALPSEEASVVRQLAIQGEKPIRLPPRVIRIWIAPWEDADGDLHQPSFIYSEISPKRGRWLFGESELVTTQPIFRPLEKKSGEKSPEHGPIRPEKGEPERERKPAQLRGSSPKGDQFRGKGGEF